MIIVQKNKPKHNHFQDLRLQMIQNQLKPSHIQNDDILDVFTKIPREYFVPKAYEHLAYHDQPIPLSKTRSMLPPLTIAQILNAIDLKSIQNALIIGCGLGYTVSVLKNLKIDVIGIDHPHFIDACHKKHSKMIEHFKAAPLIQGDIEKAPFDFIFIEGGVENVPISLIKQLNEGGYLSALIFKNSHLPLTATIFKKQNNALIPTFTFESQGMLLSEFAHATSFEF
ncbi:MAG: Protein-L-isoaspartate O-methyltransferase [Holosporales bacterium]